MDLYTLNGSGGQKMGVEKDIPTFACGIDYQSTDERTSPVQENVPVGEVEVSHEIYSIENVHARPEIFWVLAGFVSSRHVSLLQACQEHPTKFEGRICRTGNPRLVGKRARGKRSSTQHGRKLVDSIQPCLDEPCNVERCDFTM